MQAASCDVSLAQSDRLTSQVLHMCPGINFRTMNFCPRLGGPTMRPVTSGLNVDPTERLAHKQGG